MNSNIIILDFETYYDSEYSLKKMTTPAYILDDRFQTIMVAAKVNDGEHEIIDGADFPKWLEQYPAEITTTVTFNSLFDNSILAWRYNYAPYRMLDAMGMARALLGHKLTSFSLRSVADHLHLGSKGGALANMLGKTREQIKAEGLWGEFAAYALQDNVLCEGIFLRLLPEFPRAEQRVMDLVLRCCVEPKFVCDIPLLTEHLAQVKAEKEAMLEACGADKIRLMSTPKFQTMLEALGVEVKTKISPTGKVVPQFAKTDPFMAELQEHPDEQVRLLAMARLGQKSTIEETRAEKLLSIATLPWPVDQGRPLANMPIPLRYGGAHTGRLSGDWSMNMQNMPADRKKDGKSKLRASLKAPPGYKVIAADLGQIEARLCAWFCCADTLNKQFADKEDPYAALASVIFGRPINRKIDVVEGFIGKTGILGLGYGCGKDKFFTMCTQSARTMGIDQSLITRQITDAAVDAYRSMHWQIPTTWKSLDKILDRAWYGGNTMTLGPIRFEQGTVILPNNMKLNYDRPHQYSDELDQTGRGGFAYFYGKTRHKIYGAKLLENIIQALARIVVMNAALRLENRGLKFCLQAHDELVYICPDADISEASRIIHEEMVRPPSWAPTLPLTADVKSGASYADTK